MQTNKSIAGLKVPRFALNRARRLIASPAELLRAIEEASHKKDTAGNAHALKAVVEDLKAMLNLLKAWAKGRYKGISAAKLLWIAGAVVYFLMPVDLIPDFIFAAGYVDDAMVITWVLSTVGEELEKFKRWRASGEDSDNESAPNGKPLS